MNKLVKLKSYKQDENDYICLYKALYDYISLDHVTYVSSENYKTCEKKEGNKKWPVMKFTVLHTADSQRFYCLLDDKVNELVYNELGINKGE